MTIVEGADVADVVAGHIETNRGRVGADVIVLATEAYTVSLPRRCIR